LDLKNLRNTEVQSGLGERPAAKKPATVNRPQGFRRTPTVDSQEE